MKNTHIAVLMFYLLVVVSLVLGFLLYLAASDVSKDAERLNLLAQIRSKISSRTIIIDTYLIDRDRSLVPQWNTVNAEVQELLIQSQARFSPENAEWKLIHELEENNRALASANRVILNQESARSQEQDALRRILGIRQKMLTTATSLSDAFRNDAVLALQKIAFIGALALLLLILTSLVNLTWLKKTLSRLKAANDNLSSTNTQMHESHKKQEKINEELIANTSQMKKSEEALKEKIAELERFNKLTVHRELKMIELKKRLEKYENAV